ncbi:MAG: hypothetical protein M3Z36_01020 [Acidobacteriota bacterium]|nr:hypothetical protein [Acidobacteriota bacterium]
MSVNNVPLCASEGDTSVYIDAEILGNADLQLAGHDIGGPAGEVSGGDYEYWLTVRKEHKDAPLLALLQAIYRDDPLVVTKLRKLLTDNAIPHEFHCF